MCDLWLRRPICGWRNGPVGWFRGGGWGRAALGQGGLKLDGAGAGGEAREEAAVAGGRAHDEVASGLPGGEMVQGDHVQVEREPGGGGGVEDSEGGGWAHLGRGQEATWLSVRWGSRGSWGHGPKPVITANTGEG